MNRQHWNPPPSPRPEPQQVVVVQQPVHTQQVNSPGLDAVRQGLSTLTGALLLILAVQMAYLLNFLGFADLVIWLLDAMA